MPCGKKKKIRRLALIAGLLMLAAPIGAELRFTEASVTAVAQTVAINAPSLLIINDGSNEIYVRVFWIGETAADATTSSARLDADESLTLEKTIGISSISIVCAASETATARLYAW